MTDILKAVGFARNTAFVRSVLRNPLFSRTCLIEEPETCVYSFHVILKVLCIYLFIGFFFLQSCKCPEGIEEGIGFLFFCVYRNLAKVQEQLLAREFVGSGLEDITLDLYCILLSSEFFKAIL